MPGGVFVSGDTLEDGDVETSGLGWKDRESPARVVARDHRESLAVDGGASPWIQVEKKLIKMVASLPFEPIHDHPVPGLAKKDLAPMRDRGSEAPVTDMFASGDVEGRGRCPRQESCTGRTANAPEAAQDALIHTVHYHRVVRRGTPEEVPPSFSEVGAVHPRIDQDVTLADSKIDREGVGVTVSGNDGIAKRTAIKDKVERLSTAVRLEDVVAPLRERSRLPRALRPAWRGVGGIGQFSLLPQGSQEPNKVLVGVWSSQDSASSEEGPCAERWVETQVTIVARSVAQKGYSPIRASDRALEKGHGNELEQNETIVRVGFVPSGEP
jgi:hypothetical protein